jgi:hypothetical protein
MLSLWPLQTNSNRVSTCTHLQICNRACQLLLLLLQLASLKACQAPQRHAKHSLSLCAA